MPTVAEAGVPGYEVGVWFGMVAPAATPPDVLAKLNAELNKILAMPDVKQKFADQGVDPVGGTPRALRRAHRGADREVGQGGEGVRREGRVAPRRPPRPFARPLQCIAAQRMLYRACSRALTSARADHSAKT